jgi:hypothetical protein
MFPELFGVTLVGPTLDPYSGIDVPVAALLQAAAAGG